MTRHMKVMTRHAQQRQAAAPQESGHQAEAIQTASAVTQCLPEVPALGVQGCSVHTR